MNLCYISTMLAPFDEGGPGTVANYVLKEFLKIPDLDITLLTNDSATKQQIIDEFGDKFSDIFQVAEDRSNFEYVKLMTIGAKQIWKLINDNEVVHINNIWALRGFFIPPFSSIRNKPLVYTWHGLSSDDYYGEKKRGIKKIVHRADFSVNRSLWSRVIVNSEFMRYYVGRYYSIEKISLIRNGILIDDIKNAKKVELEGEVNLLFVGRLLPIKGLDLLLRALSIVTKKTTKKVKLYVAGSGPSESSYRLLTSQLGLEKTVVFLGHMPIKQCYSLFKSCTMYVVPSRFDSSSMSLLEGMAAGAPIVATKVGGNPEIIKNFDNGLLADQTPESIAEKILFLINRPEECKAMAANNCKTAEKYSWRNIALSHLNLYNSLV